MGRESVCWKRSVGKINRSENVNLKIKEEVWRKEVKMEIGLGLSTREPIPFFGRNETYDLLGLCKELRTNTAMIGVYDRAKTARLWKDCSGLNSNK